MRYCHFPVLFFIFLFLISSNSVYAVDVNIKLRKTDISELKQQIMPVYEQNIQVLQELLFCLERDKTVDACLEQSSIVSEQSDKDGYKERQEQVTLELKQKLDEKKITQEEIITELKKLLLEAERIKLCLMQGQTANDLKDCVIKYKN